jgi:hypothetical protein
VVLYVDEKSRVQARDRSRPVLPMMPGAPERRTHDHLRHAITSLFAACSIADGTVISQVHRYHRAIEFRKFLARIGKAVPAGLDVPLECGNFAATTGTRRSARRGCRLAARRTDAPDGSAVRVSGGGLALGDVRSGVSSRFSSRSRASVSISASTPYSAAPPAGR